MYIYDIYTKLCSKKNQRTSVVFLADRPSEQEQAEAEMRRLRSKQEPEATDVSLCNPKKKVGKWWLPPTFKSGWLRLKPALSSTLKFGIRVCFETGKYMKVPSGYLS